MENKNNTDIKDNKKINIKSIQFILKKSQELEKDHLLKAKNILIACLNKAEKIRPSFGSLDYNELSKFCEGLFLVANKNDRTKEITKKTLQMFFTSQIFYEILNYFRELDDEEKKKYVYAKYKTIYLKKCFDNNIKQEPGTPKNEKQNISDDDNYRGEKIFCEEVENSEMPYEDKSMNNEYKDIDFQEKNVFDSSEIQKKENKIDFNLSLKHAQYAVNALMFEDLNTAKNQLKLSLSYLEK